MPLPGEKISGSQIIVMLRENNPLAWGHLYDKYALAMYGLICDLTEDKLLAEEILIKAFLELKQKQTQLKIEYALLPIILRHTHSYTIKHLKKTGITPRTLHPPKETELIHLLTTQCHSLKEAASTLNITVEETRQNLHVAFLNLRMQNNIPVIVLVADDAKGRTAGIHKSCKS
ncbi:MAG: hypothetical protein ABIP35_11150 [Ginsengibacter sp.]